MAAKKTTKQSAPKIPVVTEKVLAPYFEEINNYPLLSREEEDRLARAMVRGDLDARDQLIRANLKFVVSIARKYASKGLPLADLINEGNMGLIMACKNYNPDRGLHFISYAVWWIRQAMAKAIAEQVKMIRLPLNRYLQLFKIKHLREQGELHNDPAHPSQLADYFNEDESAIRDILAADKNHISLDTKISVDKKSLSLEDTLVDNRVKTPEEEYHETDLRESILSCLEELPERERLVIKYRFGLDGYEPLSLNEIGKRFKITKERVRQLEKRAIQKLRESPQGHLLKNYVAA